MDTRGGTYSRNPHLVMKNLEDDRAGAVLLTLVYRAALRQLLGGNENWGLSDRN